jgi:hypothetical protein
MPSATRSRGYGEIGASEYYHRNARDLRPEFNAREGQRGGKLGNQLAKRLERRVKEKILEKLQRRVKVNGGSI